MAEVDEWMKSVIPIVTVFLMLMTLILLGLAQSCFLSLPEFSVHGRFCVRFILLSGKY